MPPALKLALRSEASSRYEKQLQPEQTLWAQAVATRLFVEVCGATARPGTMDVGGPGPEPATIRLRDARVEGLLGVAIPRERQNSGSRRSASRPSTQPTALTSRCPTSAAPTSRARLT